MKKLEENRSLIYLFLSFIAVSIWGGYSYHVLSEIPTEKNILAQQETIKYLENTPFDNINSKVFKDKKMIVKKDGMDKKILIEYKKNDTKLPVINKFSVTKGLTKNIVDR